MRREERQEREASSKSGGFRGDGKCEGGINEAVLVVERLAAGVTAGMGFEVDLLPP